MKKLVLTLSVAFSSLIVNAQYQGFENWTVDSLPTLLDYQTSANEMEDNVTASNDAHTGSFSVKLETKVNQDGDTTFGYFISGNPDNMSPGQPVTLADVDSVIGYYKADFVSGDSALFITLPTLAGNPTGGGLYYLKQSSSVWKRFAFYVGAGASDSLMIGAANGDPMNQIPGNPGSWIMFDDIQLKSSNGTTQNIVNHSFENWGTFSWELLSDWQTSSEWYVRESLFPVVKTTDAYSGNFAAELNTFIDSEGDTTWANITNGIFGQNQMLGGEPFSGNPLYMEFYYQFSSLVNDTAYVGVEFKKTGQSPIGNGVGISNQTAGYTYYALNFWGLTYPDSVLINIHGGRNPGTQFKIDHLNFVFPVGVNEYVDVERVEAYPNPAKDVLNIRFNLKENKNVAIRLIDITGKELTIVDFGELYSGVYNQTFNVSNYNSGVYFIEFLIDGQKKVERFVIK